MERDLAYERSALVRGVRQAAITADLRRATRNRLLVAGIALVGTMTTAAFFLWPHVTAWFAA